eukprot:g11028.t1
MDQTATDVRQAMARLGVHIRHDWIKHCLQGGGRGNGNAGGGTSSGGGRQAQEDVYRTFLSCDLREAGEACLPAGVGDMVKERVKGKMVVQIENARDIAKSFEQREKADGGSFHHTLKLALGDGRQTVAAFEYRRIQGLAADPPPGLKLLLVEPWVRRGILLLSSENTTVLGGEVSSLVEARQAVRAGGGGNTGAAPTTTTTNTTTPGSAGQGHQSRQPATQRAAGSGNRSQTGAVARETNAASNHDTNTSSGRPTRQPPPSPPGRGSSNSNRRAADRRRGRDHDENFDPATAGVVGLSSSSEGNSVVSAPSSSSGQRTGNGQSPAPRQQGGGSRRTGQPGRFSGVVNPYAAVTQPGPSPPAAARTLGSGGEGASNSNSNCNKSGVFSAPTQSSQNLGAASGRTASRSGEAGGRVRRGEARLPAFQDMDDDDGPEFEYLEEPDFDDEAGHTGTDIEQEPPDDAPTGLGGAKPGEAPGGDGDARNRGTGNGVVQASPPPPPLPATPRPRARPKIVSARAQLREEGGRGGEGQGQRRRRGREDGGGGSGVVDIEEDFHGGATSAEGSGGGLKFPRRKRGRSDNHLGGGGELEQGDEPLSSPPGGPYTALEDLDRLTAAGGGVFRVKAVVSDTMGCKIRKKKYLLAVEIEDGTAVVRVRLSEQITRRLFGVEAREFKKIYQKNEDQASRIQARVENEIKQMEGVMEIDTFAAASASQQSTPGTATSQSPATATSDPEWLLPVVTSVSPPTDADCRELLSRVSL